MKNKLAFIVIAISLLLSGCGQKIESSSELSSKDISENGSPQENVEDSSSFIFEGFETLMDDSGSGFNIGGGVYEHDGDNLLTIDSTGFIIYKLPNKTPIKRIPIEGEERGFDISGDIIVWSSLKNQANPEIYIYNLKTSEQKKITDNPSGQYYPKIWKNYIVWQDDRNAAVKTYPGQWSLYLYNLDTGEEKLLTKTLAPHATYNICDNKVVWEDERNMHGDDLLRSGDNLPENNKDIYLYDIKADRETAVATGPFMECMPDIYGNYIVWEDRNNGTLAADIVLYNIANKEKKYITKDDYHQGNPKIFENFVVWMDERNGISTNDIFIDGKAPNSDIFIYDIEKGTERNLTGEGPQILPSISSKWVVYVLSRQIGSRIEALEYIE